MIIGINKIIKLQQWLIQKAQIDQIDIIAKVHMINLYDSASLLRGLQNLAEEEWMWKKKKIIKNEQQ